jgi:hypothetical protein
MPVLTSTWSARVTSSVLEVDVPRRTRKISSSRLFSGFEPRVHRNVGASFCAICCVVSWHSILVPGVRHLAASATGALVLRSSAQTPPVPTIGILVFDDRCILGSYHSTALTLARYALAKFTRLFSIFLLLFGVYRTNVPPRRHSKAQQKKPRSARKICTTHME